MHSIICINRENYEPEPVVVCQPLLTGFPAIPAAHPPRHPIYGGGRMIFTGALLGGRFLH